jgi:hypothetical protein
VRFIVDVEAVEGRWLSTSFHRGGGPGSPFSREGCKRRRKSIDNIHKWGRLLDFSAGWL